MQQIQETPERPLIAWRNRREDKLAGGAGGVSPILAFTLIGLEAAIDFLEAETRLFSEMVSSTQLFCFT